MENRNSDRYLCLVTKMNPDMLLAVETDEWWVESLACLQAAYPYRVAKPQNNHYGMTFFSKLPIEDVEVRFLVENDVPSIHASFQLPSGDTIFFHGLHPRPPHPYPLTDATTRDAELITVGKSVKEENQPAIVAGDLNDVAWSHTTRLFQRISGLLDPRIGRGMYNSFHASLPLFRWPLDHEFHSRHFQLVELQRLPAFGSDHFPIYVKLHYEPLISGEQPLPAATVEDHQEAEEKIDNAEEVTGRPVESPQEEVVAPPQKVDQIVQSASTDYGKGSCSYS
ncbi:MAG: endonuclease/exonuclease/phosphatase family protein [Candidatus Binatia bacterium]